MRRLSGYAVANVSLIGFGGWMMGYGSAQDGTPWWWVALAVLLLGSEAWLHLFDRNDALEWV